MKLPAPNDPHGDAEGALSRGQVLDTLFRHGVSVNHDPDGNVTLETAEVIEVVLLPELVGGLQIRHLARTFGISLTAFYFGHKVRMN